MAMMRGTGCDGVVVGRGCLGRPWLFRDLVEALNGRPVPPSPDARRGLRGDGPPRPPAGRSSRRGPGDARLPQAHLVVLHRLPGRGRDAPAFANVSTLGELEDLIAAVDPAITIVAGGERIRRGHTNGPIESPCRMGISTTRLDDLKMPDDADVMALSGG